MSVRERFKEVFKDSGKELAGASPLHKALFAAGLAGVVFEWWTGNEALIGWATTSTLGATNNAALAGLAGGAASFAEQATLGVLAAVNVNNLPGAMQSVRTNLFPNKGKDKPSDTPETKRSKASRAAGRFSTAMLFGSSLLVLKDNALKEQSLQKNSKDALITAGMVGVGVTGIAGSISALKYVADAFHLEQAADTAIDVASNPLAWTALFGVIAAASYGSGKITDAIEARKTSKILEETYDMDNPAAESEE